MIKQVSKLSWKEQLEEYYKGPLDQFSRACSGLLDTIKSNMYINQDDMDKLEQSILLLISHRIDPRSQDAFEKLYLNLSDYMQYKLTEDTIARRSHSYTQLYQLLRFLKQYCTRLDMETQALKAEHQLNDIERTSYLKILSYIKRYASCEALVERSPSAESLKKRLAALEAGGFITPLVMGSQVYYRLSPLGKELLKYLMFPERSPWATYWSNNRIQLFNKLIHYFKEHMIHISMVNLVDFTASIPDAQVNCLVEGPGKFMKPSLSNFNLDRQAVESTLYIDVQNRGKLYVTR